MKAITNQQPGKNKETISSFKKQTKKRTDIGGCPTKGYG